MLAEKGNGEAEFMHDAGGNGQVNDTGEPVANGAARAAAHVAEGREVRQEVLGLLLAQRHGRGRQVGATTTIPSAAAVQDIGLFVVSHIAGTKAHGQVHNWSLDTDPSRPG